MPRFINVMGADVLHSHSEYVFLWYAIVAVADHQGRPIPTPPEIHQSVMEEIKSRKKKKK